MSASPDGKRYSVKRYSVLGFRRGSGGKLKAYRPDIYKTFVFDTYDQAEEFMMYWEDLIRRYIDDDDDIIQEEDLPGQFHPEKITGPSETYYESGDRIAERLRQCNILMARRKALNETAAMRSVLPLEIAEPSHRFVQRYFM